MLVRNKDEVSTATKEGLVSHILLEEGGVSSDEFVVTWVEVDAGERQMMHHHEPEQVYIIIEGSGEMYVDHESEHVDRGTMVYIPSHADHYIQNTGDGLLTYVSIGTPTMKVSAFYDEEG